MSLVENRYSVLMSVYHKEKAEYLREAMESIHTQTVSTDDFVLVCDGPLNEELDAVIAQMQVKFGSVLQVIRLEKNSGLGNALNTGLKYCKNDIVARMDSDDISLPDRCEKELAIFERQPQIAIVSGLILEFQDSPEMITGKREVPEQHDEILRFSRKRNPFNHPAVMFRKSAVEKAGGYKETYHLFEDYYLWVRMLQCGSVGYNIPTSVLYMRTSPDMYMRRGGKNYAKAMLHFRRWMVQTGWIGNMEFITGALPHAMVCILPNRVRGMIYKALH